MKMNTYCCCCCCRHIIASNGLRKDWGKYCTIERNKSCPTDLFDQIQVDIPWRLGEDLTVPTPHHITLGRCPVSHSGHQEPCFITPAADLTLSGHPRTRLHPHWLKEIMNERWSQPLPSLDGLVSALTLRQNTANTFKCCTSSWTYSRQVTLTLSVPLGKPPFLKVSSLDWLEREGGHPCGVYRGPSIMTSYFEEKAGKKEFKWVFASWLYFLF